MEFSFLYRIPEKISLHMVGDSRYTELAIPNREVRYIYNNTIMNWFRKEIKMRDLTALYRSLLDGDAETFQKELSLLLMESISYLDGQEDGESLSPSFGGKYYHGFLLGILENLKEYLITSNRESGLGQYDIALRHLDVTKTPVILELKISDTFKGMEAACNTALKQIRDKHYNDWLPEEGYSEVLDYGIAFFKKQCRVKVLRTKFQQNKRGFPHLYRRREESPKTNIAAVAGIYPPLT